MKTIISQKLINVLKNKIFNVISLNLFDNVESLLNSLLCNDSSNKKYFYIDKIFDLPKNNHYNPIVKAISISKSVSTSQAEAVP